jgi:hypothetical protein
METNRAAYWIALGVLALGLNSEYRQGNFLALHRVADRAGSVLCRISTRAEQTFAVATELKSRPQFVVDDMLASASRAEAVREQSKWVREQARDEAELLRDRVRDQIRAQADVLRVQADVRRAEIEQVRFRMRSQVRLANTTSREMTVVCPKTGTRIVVNAGTDLEDTSPDVEVGETF